MTDFPSSPEEFYRLRDDRTNRCVSSGAYQQVHCAVYLAPDRAETADGQLMLFAAANLLSRWCRRVTIALPASVAVSEVGSGDLGELVLSQMRDADPFGDFRTVDIATAIRSDAALCVGSWVPGANTPSVFIDASGWLAALSHSQVVSLPPSHSANRFGAIMAGCLGVAQLFKTAVGMPVERRFREGTFDVSRLGWLEDPPLGWPTDLEVGKVLMVGAGSVGSATAYCARLIGLRGSMDVVDRDTSKVENFNRSPIFGRATFGQTKARAVAHYLDGSGLSATPVDEWWSEFVQRKGRLSFDYDVWLPLANEFDVRRSMQQNGPPLMVHASTGVNWGVNHGRHVPGLDDCLVDRFPSDGAGARLICSTAQVMTTVGGVDAALPFASMFAGLLIVADLVRAQLPDYPQVANLGTFDLYGPMDLIQLSNRSPRPGCLCRDQGRAFHDRFNSTSRYRKYFSPV